MGRLILPGRNTSVNSLWSIWYCILVLGLQAYITYVAISHYRASNKLRWGNNNTAPSELSAHVALICLSLLCVPVFVISSLFRVGNYANDGVKFGRDHVLRVDLNMLSRPAKVKWLKTIWKHFCPISQTLHLIMAFCALIPTTMTIAVEIKYGYQTTDTIWKTDLDFLYPSHRVHLSDRKSLGYNATEASNGISGILPSSTPFTQNASVPGIPGTGGWSYHSSVTPAYVNFCAALLAYSVRYPAVFWYTNKVLSCIFAATLLGMTLESFFAFCGFSILYKLSVNSGVYSQLSLVLGPSSVLVLYMISGFLLLLSSMAVFEYGFHFFHQKFRIVEQKHHPHVVKQMMMIQSSCHGYIPHFCAMAALVLLASCKGPIIYDLVTAYRVTGDMLALSCVIVDVCYMLLWIGLWFVLTIKQQWRFRILDYMPVGSPVFTIQNEHVVQNPNFEADLERIELTEVKRRKKRRVRANPTLSLELTVSDRSDDTETATDDPDDDLDLEQMPDPGFLENPGAEGLARQGSAAAAGVLVRKAKHRRSLGQRVTFNDDIKTKNLTDDESFDKRSRSPGNSMTNLEQNNVLVAVKAEVHDPAARLRHGRGSSPAKNGGNKIVCVGNPTTPPSSSMVKLRNDHQPGSRDSTMTREYRKNIRSKCDEYYVNRPGSGTFLNDVEEGSQESLAGSGSVISIKLDSPRTPPDGGTPVKFAPISNSDSAINNKSEAIHRSSREKSPVKESNRNSLNLDKRRSGSYTDNQICNLKDLKAIDIRNSSLNLRTSPDIKPDIVPVDGNHLLPSRPLRLVVKKPEIGRRDSANYSMASSQETSSNDSDHGLCSQV